MKTKMVRLPRVFKCAGCGRQGPGAHWHGYDRLGKQKRYCSAECCPRHSEVEEWADDELEVEEW